jgi:hypothetical protein
MKVIKLFVLMSAFFIFSMELHAKLGLSDDSLVEVKPKTCDFQWWKGSKIYNTTSTTTDKTSENKTGTTER